MMAVHFLWAEFSIETCSLVKDHVCIDMKIDSSDFDHLPCTSDDIIEDDRISAGHVPFSCSIVRETYENLLTKLLPKMSSSICL